MEPYILEFANLAKGFEPQIKALWYELLDICTSKLGKLGLKFQKAECTNSPKCQAYFSIQNQRRWAREFDYKTDSSLLYYKGKDAEDLIPLAEGHFRPVEQSYMSDIYVPANNPIVLEYKEAARRLSNKLVNFNHEAGRLCKIACQLYNDLMPLFSLLDLKIPSCVKASYELYLTDTIYLLYIFVAPPDEDVSPIDELFGLSKTGQISVWGPSAIKGATFYSTICGIIKERELLQEILKNPEEFKTLIKELLM